MAGTRLGRRAASTTPSRKVREALAAGPRDRRGATCCLGQLPEESRSGRRRRSRRYRAGARPRPRAPGRALQPRRRLQGPGAASSEARLGFERGASAGPAQRQGALAARRPVDAQWTSRNAPRPSSRTRSSAQRGRAPLPARGREPTSRPSATTRRSSALQKALAEKQPTAGRRPASTSGSSTRRRSEPQRGDRAPYEGRSWRRTPKAYRAAFNLACESCCRQAGRNEEAGAPVPRRSCDVRPDRDRPSTWREAPARRGRPGLARAVGAQGPRVQATPASRRSGTTCSADVYNRQGRTADAEREYRPRRRLQRNASRWVARRPADRPAAEVRSYSRLRCGSRPPSARGAP